MVSAKKGNKNNFLNKHFFIKWIVIPVTLLLFWVFSSLFYIYKYLGISVMTYSHEKSEIISKNTRELLAGEKIKGEFRARDDNLGIVAVRFNTYFRINEDEVIFRIKEKGSTNWYYEYGYTTPQFQPDKYFTFGFPIISNSNGRFYYFEIESTKGRYGNAVALSRIEPIYETRYQYSKELIFKDVKYATRFITRKILHPIDNSYLSDFLVRKSINTFTNTNFVTSFIFFASPLVLYFVWLIFFNRYLSNKFYLTLIPILLMVLLSLINATQNDYAVIGMALLWLSFSYVYRLKSSITIILSLIFIILSFVLFYISINEISTNLTVWGYMLLVVGVFQQIIELKWKGVKRLGLLDLKDIYFPTKKVKKRVGKK